MLREGPKVPIERMCELGLAYLEANYEKSNAWSAARFCIQLGGAGLLVHGYFGNARAF